MTARQNVLDDMVGDTTCASGAYSGSDCGVLKDYDFAYYNSTYGKWLLSQRVADYIRTPGDSGAPVFRGTLALGSHVNFQSDTGWAIYSHVWFAEQRLGLAMCSSSC